MRIAPLGKLCARSVAVPADNGQPIVRDRWDFFARTWIGPYEKLLPQWTYVAISGGVIVGYLTGCPDSKNFSRHKFWRVDVPLLAEIACGRYRRATGAREFIRAVLGQSKRAEQHFSRALQQKLMCIYPAHLHINVEASYRRAGLGRRLIESYFADLRKHGIAGVHLFCGPDPVEFYRRLNFQVLEAAPLGNTTVFLLGQRL